MNKHLLLGCALIAAISAYPQAGKQAKPASPRLIKIEAPRDEANPIHNPKPNYVAPKSNTAAKTATAAASTIKWFSNSYNAFGFYQDGHEALQYNADLNAVSFVMRAGPNYSTTPNGNSGTISGKYTTNNGGTWDSTTIYATPATKGRYPQGGIWNTPGNTNISNAYIVCMGEYVGTAFDGAYAQSKQLSVPGTFTISGDQQTWPNLTPFGNIGTRVDFPRYGFSYTQDGFVRGIGELVENTNGTSWSTIKPKGDIILKGMFSAGSFTWTADSLKPSVNTRPSDGSNILYLRQNLMAWNDAGTIGYVVMWGSRAGESFSSGGQDWATVKGGIQPIVYKTTNSGTSWSLLPAVDWTGPQFQALADRCWGTTTGTAVPMFACNEGADAAVDINGNLHIVTTVLGHYSSNLDSLDYWGQFTVGSEQYTYPYGAFGMPTIYDFYTTSSGNWDYHVVDSMATEGPSGTTGDPGASANPWTVGGIPIDARIQIAFSPDRAKMFYSWTETDATLSGNNWNIYPDIISRGFDVTIDKVTPRLNVTAPLAGTPLASANAWFHFMSNRTMSVSATQWEIPFTISYNASYDGNDPMDHYYLSGASFVQGDFTITPMRPTGVQETAGSITSSDVMTYPNPASESTTIKVNLNDSKAFDISIYNTVGQLIQTIPVQGQKGSNEIKLDLSKLSKGVYIYNVKADGAVISNKLVVE